MLDKDLIEEVNGDNSRWNAPLLITGCARSGTTELVKALSTHPKICIFNEFALYHPLKNHMSTWYRILEMRKDNTLPDKVSDSIGQLKTDFERALPLHASDRGTRDWLFNSIGGNLDVYGDKMPYHYLLKMREIAREFPNSRFLIMIRDGRDVIAFQVRAYRRDIRKGRHPPSWATVEEALYLWLRSANNWLGIRDNPPLPCLEVRYEQATASPMESTRELCRFTGLEYRPDEFGEFSKLYRAVHTGSWREELGDMEQRLLPEFLCALEQLGYR